MAKILHLPAQSPARFGFKRARRRKMDRLEEHGQLNLFSRPARILSLAGEIGAFEEAFRLDEKGDDRAAEAYQHAIEEEDCVADAYCNLGILEFRAGRTSRAFDCFTKSLERDPRHFESHYNLGNLYFELGDLQLARHHYEIAAEIDPGFANLYFNLGLVLAILEDFEGAIKALNRYQELVPEEEAGKANELLATLKKSQAAHP